MDIYKILSTKAKNERQVRIYVKFIERCNKLNLENKNLGYTELHHICPKAKDLFPEYEDLKVHKWNGINLTAYQHIVAHIISWKAFGGSQAFALKCMLGNFNSRTNELLSERIIPNSIEIKYLALVREDVAQRKSELSKGRAAYKDSDGTVYYLEVTDPLIEELGLVGATTGLKMTEESKEKMRRAKDSYRKVRLFKLDKRKNILLSNVDAIEKLLVDGWNYELTDEDKNYIKEQSNLKTSIAMTGRTDYRYPDGTFYGKLLHDNPIIKELNLSYQVTEKQRKQHKAVLGLGAVHNTGKKAYNNGEIEKNFVPGEEPAGWIAGGLKRKKYNVTVDFSGCKFYTDGIQNFRVKVGDTIEAHWREGRYDVGKKKNYTNGVIQRRFVPGTEPEGFVLGILPIQRRKSGT